jgi:phthalate 4,5-cis-dihydrodiol dehydrogenase
MEVLRLGIIGLGMAVTRILAERPGIVGLPYIQLTAATDPREQALARFREEFGGQTFASAEELCASDAVDAVYIATPPELHAEQTILAAEHGKHVIVEKPLALTIEDAEAMNAAADRNGIKLVAGHTHSFDPPIRKMREIVRGGELGKLSTINTWNFNEFNHRPWPGRELESTHGPLFNQGPHQVDIVRLIGGGLVRSVRANTFWDQDRPPEGGYTAYLEFEDAVPATLVYDARGFFDTAELYWWIAEGGLPRDPDTNLKMRRSLKKLGSGSDLERQLEAQKEQMRYGADIQGETPEVWEVWRGGHHAQGERHQPFFGITVVACERGAMRQSRDGLIVYGAEDRWEVPVDQSLRGRAAEVTELYEGVVNGRPIFHDGRWGAATLEVCLGILQSARERREILMRHQVPVGD